MPHCQRVLVPSIARPLGLQRAIKFMRAFRCWRSSTASSAVMGGPASLQPLGLATAAAASPCNPPRCLSFCIHHPVPNRPSECISRFTSTCTARRLVCHRTDVREAGARFRARRLHCARVRDSLHPAARAVSHTLECTAITVRRPAVVSITFMQCATPLRNGI